MHKPIDLLSYIFDLIRTPYGIAVFLFTGKTPTYAHFTLRRLFTFTNGRVNTGISRILSLKNGTYPLRDLEGVVGIRHIDDAQDIADKISNDGFYICEHRLSETDITSLVQLAKQTPCVVVGDDVSSMKTAIYNEEDPTHVRYNVPEPTLIQNETVQKLMSDMSILAVAQEYLKTKPILDLVSMWWSTSIKASPDYNAAQLFHFDMDRVRFLKVFIYLTDVTPETGPHCFVRGSHLHKPSALRSDGRISDDRIRDFYGSSEMIELTGKPGTMIFADTSGFHKGKLLSKGHRLILQLEFANSLFGMPYKTFPQLEPVTKVFSEKRRQYPRTYSRFQ